MSRRKQLLLALSSTLVIYLVWFQQGNLVLLIGVLFALPVVISQAFIICVGFIIFSYFRIHEAFPVLIPLHIHSYLHLPVLLALVGNYGLNEKRSHGKPYTPNW